MVIFVSGSINSGKSTVAALLHRKIANSALVEVDKLREFIEWMPIDQSIPINLQNAISIIKNFSCNGIHSIVPYPLSGKNYEYLMAGLNEISDVVHIFVLNPKLGTVLTDRGGRTLTEWERDRIRYHYETHINNPGFGIVIDNTDQMPDETVLEVLRHLG